VAVVILFLSVGVGTYLYGQDRTRSRERAKDTTTVTLSAEELDALDLETRAYYFAHEILRERMDVPSGHDTKELDVIDELLLDRMENYINDTYPVTEGAFHIRVKDWDVRLILDEMNTTDLLEDVRREQCGRTYVMDNSSLVELATHAAPMVFPTTNTPYFRLVGHARYEIYNMEENVVFDKYSTFNKNLYSPLPLMKNLALRFTGGTSGEFGELGRMVRYMVTTLAQYRVLSGYGGGGYGGPHDGKGVGDIITSQDVEVALNLGLLLMEARYFRNYDEEAAREQTKVNGSGQSVERLMDQYVNNGSIDPADLIALYEDLPNSTYDVNRIFAQSVYSFADRFAWELLKLFWGEEWDPEGDGTWDNQYYFDPNLEEPIVDWENIEARADTEDWCRERLMRWLEVFGKWLGITETGDENGELAMIEAQPEESALIKDIYSRYRHPPMAGEPAGVPSGMDLCDVITPPFGYGEPNYYVTGNDAYHVDGRYYLFGDAGDGLFSDKKWYVRSYVRPEESNQGEATDARYLLLGESPGAGDDDRRPHTFKIVCRDDWGSNVGERTYEYYAVKESLIEKHGDYSDAAGDYYGTLRFIVDALTRSVKQQPSDPDNVNSKGMMDYAAWDVERTLSEAENGMDVDPGDERFVITREIEDAFRDDEGAVKKSLDEFSNAAAQEKENWFRQGAYLNDTEDPGGSGEFFLYDLLRETVDLWYEMVANLYDGGYRDFDEDVSSTYGPEDGPEHWNNYENEGNSELPREKYQESGHETESGSDKLAGSFKFRNDALRDCHYRVMETVKTRDDAMEFTFNNWEDMGSQHYRWQAKGSCGQAGVLFGWVYAGSGTAAVPFQDQQMIPREVYDGTGSAEDLTPSDDPWKNPAHTHAEPVWDVLKTGNSGQTNLANNDQGDGIRGRVGNTVGWSGWAETTNHGLLDDVREEFIEGSGGQGGLDLITDEGGYGADGGVYDFNSDFYDLAKRNVGSIFIEDNALWDRLGREDGWLQTLVKGETVDRIGDHADVMNVPYLTASRRNVTWRFWHGQRERAAGNGSLFTEFLAVEQEPKRLAAGGESLNVDIRIPGNGTHFVDVQDTDFPMSRDCFSAVWLVNITANFSMSLRNSRLSSMGEGGHDTFCYNFSNDLQIDFPVPIYSGWDLESGWQTGDIRYRMSRGYFGKVGQDSPEAPFFISKELCETVDATKDAADWMMDTKIFSLPLVGRTPMMGGKGTSRSLCALVDIFTSSVDPRDTEEGLLETASLDSDYASNISSSATVLGDAGLSEIGLHYFGYVSSYYPNNQTLSMGRSSPDGERRNTSLEYTMRFDNSMNLSARDSIDKSTHLNTFLDGSSSAFSATGSISPYGQIASGLYHNITIRSEGTAAEEHGASGQVTYMPVSLLNRNATVSIGISSSDPIPDALRKAVEDTERFELENHRDADLLGQCTRHLEYFLGVLYNDHIGALANADHLALFVNMTDGWGGPTGYLNRSYGMELEGIPQENRGTALRGFLKHCINRSESIITTLIEPSVHTSFFMKLPGDIEGELFLGIRHISGDKKVRWRGTLSGTATPTPYIGSPWNAGPDHLMGGVIPEAGDTEYILWFRMDSGR